MIGAHCGMLFPLSGYLSAVETLPYTGGPSQVNEVQFIFHLPLPLPGGAGWNKHQSCGCSEGSDLLGSLSSG